MRRGAYLEKELQRILCFLNENGVHAHKNHCDRTVDGVYLEGEPYDYEVFANPVHVFDAKEAQGDRWPLSNAKPMQVKHLLNCAAHGAEAYFLVLFGGCDLRRFDVEFVNVAIAAGRKTLDKFEGKSWDWRIFLNGDEQDV